MPAWLFAVVLTAATPTARVVLHHSRGAQAQQCPDESWLVGNVTARLGYDPFTDDAPLTATTRFECDPAGCRAELELTRAGEAPRRRTLSSPSGDCRELAESLALTVALAVDPALLSRPAPRPVIVAAPPTPTPSPPPTPPRPVESSPTVRFQAQLGATGSLGLSPAPTVGVRLGVGLRRGWFGLLLEGRADLAQRVATAGGEVWTSVLVATLLPCWHWHGLGLCVSGTAGALQVEGTLPGGQRESGPLAAVGARASYEYLFLPWLGAVAHAAVQGVLTRLTVVANGESVWVTGPVTAELGVGVVTLF